MKTFGRLALLGLLGVFVLVAAFAIYVSRENAELSDGFAKVEAGQTREQVIASMGLPTSSSTTCSAPLTWMEQPVTGTCVLQFRYDASYIIRYYIVGFDDRDRAISKNVAVSY